MGRPEWAGKTKEAQLPSSEMDLTGPRGESGPARCLTRTWCSVAACGIKWNWEGTRKPLGHSDVWDGIWGHCEISRDGAVCVACRWRAKCEQRPRGRILKEQEGSGFAQSLECLGGAGRDYVKWL